MIIQDSCFNGPVPNKSCFFQLPDLHSYQLIEIDNRSREKANIRNKICVPLDNLVDERCDVRVCAIRHQKLDSSGFKNTIKIV
jgi:hypothetical protein